MGGAKEEIKVETKMVPSICSYCGTGCGVLYQVADNEILATWPMGSHPVNQGKLCVKGWNLHRVANSFMRLKDPLVRLNGSFKRATWKKAIEYTAQQLMETRDKYGPDSVGVLVSAKVTNEENYLAQKMARAIIGTNNVDHCARL